MLYQQESVSRRRGVGRYMSTDYLTFLKHEEAGDVIEKIRTLASKKNFPASYTYVVDDDGILQGVLNMRDLMLARPEQPLSAFMIANVFTLHCFMDRSEATREMAKRKYFAAPIVDNENRILGVIKAENMLTGLQVEMADETFGDNLRWPGREAARRRTRRR